MDFRLLVGITTKMLLNAFQYTFGLRLVSADTHSEVFPDPGFPQIAIANEQLGNGSICR